MKVNATVGISLAKIGINVAPNTDTRAIEVGLEDYRVKILKKNQDLMINAGGFTFTSFFELRKLYDFLTKDMGKLKTVLNDLKPKESYREFLEKNKKMQFEEADIEEDL